MASGQLTSKELVRGYLRRINSLNPLLHSVIETNPDALEIAERLDNQRRRGHVRGRFTEFLFSEGQYRD